MKASPPLSLLPFSSNFAIPAIFEIFVDKLCAIAGKNPC